MRIDQQAPCGQASTSAGDARPRELTGSACVRSRIIGEPDRAAEPPVDLAASWEQGVAQLTRDHRQRPWRAGLSRGRRVVPRRSLRGSTFPTRRRRVLARIRRRTSRPPPRPSAARPPASSPGDLRRRPYSCSTAGQYLSVDQPVKPTTRGGAPNLFHAAATVAERRERRGGHMTASAHLLIALMSGCRGLGGRGQISARTTRRRSATDCKP